MKWIEKIVNDAKRKSANAAVARVNKALLKYQSWLEKLPPEWTTRDLMKLTGMDQPNARELAKRMQKHGLIYPARHMTLYARRKPGTEKPVKEVGNREEMREMRHAEWLQDVPEWDFSVNDAQKIWALGYDSTRYRIRILTELGKLESVKWGWYRRVK